jgi:hypothetical protein
MQNRITRAHIVAKAAIINRMTNSPAESSRLVDGKYVSNVGNYHISGAYGGVCLHRMCNESGGVRDVFDCGHVPARKLADLMSAYIAGLNDATKD